LRRSSLGLVYQHKVTGEKIILNRVTSGMWYREDETGKRIHYKLKDLKDYKYLKNESNPGGWKAQRYQIRKDKYASVFGE